MPKQTPTAAEIKEWQEKAAKWDALNEKIYGCYFDEDGNELLEESEPGLDYIGQLAATAFGYF